MSISPAMHQDLMRQSRRAHDELERAQAAHRNVALLLKLRLRALLLDVDFESAEAISAAMGALWGLWLLLPLDTFGASPLWRTVQLLFSEAQLGTIVCAGGTGAFVAMLWGSRQWRMWLTLFGAATWGGLSGLFIWANPAASSSVVYPVLTLVAAWAYLRLAIRRGGRWVD